jgi:RNA polymerase sigma-70 factor (ECF subfamily)
MGCSGLILRIQSGDQEAFGELYEAYKRKVYSLCLRMTRNVEEAEDLTQEAFVQVFLKLHTFRGESAFSTWLHQVVVNIVLMRFRRRRHEIALDDMLPQERADESVALETKDELLANSVHRVALERAMDQLPPGYRLVFVLHDIMGYEHQEIAEILGCSCGNGKSQLHKARRKLRKVLSGLPMRPEVQAA